MDILAKLGIHWSQLAAQAVNFTIIVTVLTYFVYKPLLKLIDERRERIRQAMEDADRIQNQKAEIDQFRLQEMKKIDSEAGALLERTKKQSVELKDQMLQAAMRESESILKRGREQLEEERIRAFDELQRKVTTLAVVLASKVIEREFTKDDQDRLTANLEKELPKLLS